MTVMRVFNIMIMTIKITSTMARVNTELTRPETSATENLEKII